MKTLKLNKRFFLAIATMFLLLLPLLMTAQEPKKGNDALDQNISIYAEDEPLSGVIEKI